MLELRNISKKYENQPLLEGVTFSVAEGETVCLLGPSGSGKSTLLRIIAGIEQPDSGQVLWNGQDLAQVPPHKRGFGLMFQDYALFPHRNVIENVNFGLRMQGLPRQEIDQRARQALAQVNLLDFRRRRVTDLSGGEQQRVALARALAPRPYLLMLDEPLGALDRNLREQLLQELRSILRSTRMPAVYVTHDQEEAFTIADRLVLLHDGRIVQEGRPEDFRDSPSSPWVARFFGLGSILTGSVTSVDPLKIILEGREFGIECPGGGHHSGEELTVLLRPSLVDISRDGFGEKEINVLDGEIVDVIFDGSRYRLGVRLNGGKSVYFYVSEHWDQGEQLAFHLNPGALLCLGTSGS